MDPVLSHIRAYLSAGTPVTTAGGLTTPLGSLTTPNVEAGGLTTCPTSNSMTPPGGLTTRVAEYSGPTARQMALTTSPMPRVTMTTLASPTHHAWHR
jgi:hypothetical protein